MQSKPGTHKKSCIPECGDVFGAFQRIVLKGGS